MNTPLPYRIGERLVSIDQVCVNYDKPVLSGVSATIDNIIRDDMAQGGGIVPGDLDQKVKNIRLMIENA